MIIKAIVENTSNRQDLAWEHGLSLYIETQKHKLLFDTGASALFAQNAAKLDIDLAAIDTVILSHGHYDHGGGLATFLKYNSKAKIYLHQHAFGPYYSQKSNGEKGYIGLDETLLPNERFVFVQDEWVLDEELTLFSGVKGHELQPSGNRTLLKKMGHDFEPDDFAHEQNLIIRENGKTALIVGCAHKGIVNILKHFSALYTDIPHCVVGGFHLYNCITDETEDAAIIKQIAQFLLTIDTTYYTCHCTGMVAYEQLKTIMKEKIQYLATGEQILL